MTPLEITPLPRALRLSTHFRGGYRVAALSGELDFASVPELRDQLLGVLRPDACRLIVDLSQVSFCDASGLAVLVGTNRRARLLRGVLRLAAPARAWTCSSTFSLRFRQPSSGPRERKLTGSPLSKQPERVPDQV